ncbi:response regulator transcription factor [Anoxybacteroides amylolyticum]|uniref:Bacterial regulatory s, luxR family protein n=1 Tax=Anoxybacteroides amylolyticum TaxID=294699 RepID=A0A160F4I5_9BACL|nr:response regulator transcription factor [Anoxybacillus amylolyticus]ANB61359.1 bacterial regulatory s, luxR family protein [Anoxybacillus amylolyticus]
MDTGELLQSIQNAYASLIGLPIVIIDSSKTSITSISHINDFSKEMICSVQEEIQMMLSKNWDDYLQLTSPMMIDAVFDGVKAIIAPIIVEEQVRYLIWGGPFLLFGGKEKLKNNVRFAEIIQTASEYSLLNIQTKMQMMKEMAHVCSRLVEAEQKQEKSTEQLRKWYQVAEWSLWKTDFIESYLHLFRNLHASIDIVAYAERTEEKYFIIQEVSSREEEKKWLGAVYSIDHPVVSWIVQKGRPLYLEHIERKWQFADSLHKNSELKTLYLYPIKDGESVSGCIFVGSKEKVRLSEEIKEKGRLLTKFIELLRCCQESSLVKKQFSKLEKLSKLMEKKRIDEMMQMAADLSCDLVDGERSTLVLQKGDEKKIFTSSKRNLVYRGRDESREKFSQDILFQQPNKSIIERPFFVNEHLQGIVTVQLEKREVTKEQELSLSLLVAWLKTFLEHSFSSQQETASNIAQQYFSQILTPREMDVLKHLIEGCSNNEIAAKLYVSVHTVKNHITNIFQKLEVKDRSQLIAMVYQLNFERNMPSVFFNEKDGCQ